MRSLGCTAGFTAASRSRSGGKEKVSLERSKEPTHRSASISDPALAWGSTTPPLHTRATRLGLRFRPPRLLRMIIATPSPPETTLLTDREVKCKRKAFRRRDRSDYNNLTCNTFNRKGHFRFKGFLVRRSTLPRRLIEVSPINSCRTWNSDTNLG